MTHESIPPTSSGIGDRVLEAAPIIIVMLGPDGTIRYANPFFEQLSGYRLAEIHGKDWARTFIPERDHEAMRGRFARAMAGQVPKGVVSPIVSRTGSEYDIEWTCELLRDPDGQVGLLAIGRDVTKSVAADRALRKSEQRLLEAHRLARLGAWELDLRTRKAWWSDEQYRMFGIEPGTPIELADFVALIHPDDRAVFERAFTRTLEQGSDELELRLVCPGGEVRDIASRARVIRDELGQAVALTGTNQDITEQKRAAHAAKRAAEVFRTVVTQAPVIVFGIDRDGVFTLSEGRGLEKLGLRPGEVVGASVFELYAHVPEIPETIRRTLAGESSMLLVSINDAWFETAFGPSYDAHGEIDGLIGVALDVTERKHAELELRESMTEQQRLLAEMVEIDRRKTEFIAVLSHELRNPLGAIRTAVHVLGHAPPGTRPTSRALEIADRQVAQLARLVDDLLDVSRISQNKLMLQRASIDLVELARRTVDDLASEFARRSVQLVVELPDAPMFVHGDAARLTQVIGNLLHNAVKFTPAGGSTTISVARDTTDHAVIRVVDTGVGIEPRMLEKLFQPFAQADRTLERSAGGLGLGLALVKGLIELHGGQVSASSDGAGRGAELVVRLPLEQPATRASVRREAEREPTVTRKVLVIEDNADVAETLAEVLALEGHAVDIAHDGLTGIQRARASRPDVVICDLGLPGLSGYDVARALVSAESRATLIALSGYAAPEDVARAREAGFDDHLAKPVDIPRLRRVLAGTAPQHG